MNRVILSGNLARDVEVKSTSSGKTYARTSIAVNRRTKKADGTYDADFFDLAAWDKTAEIMGKYLKKGDRVIVEGRIENDNYKDKSGAMKYGNKIVVDNVEWFQSQNRKQHDEPDDDEFDADVPF